MNPLPIDRHKQAQSRFDKLKIMQIQTTNGRYLITHSLPSFTRPRTDEVSPPLCEQPNTTDRPNSPNGPGSRVLRCWYHELRYCNPPGCSHGEWLPPLMRFQRQIKGKVAGFSSIGRRNIKSDKRRVRSGDLRDKLISNSNVWI